MSSTSLNFALSFLIAANVRLEGLKCKITSPKVAKTQRNWIMPAARQPLLVREKCARFRGKKNAFPSRLCVFGRAWFNGTASNQAAGF
jgi:hypothetical protein